MLPRGPARWVGWSAILCCIAVRAYAQPTAPIGDRVDEPLCPGGISQLPVTLNARLAHAFKDRDGTDVLHLAGDLLLTIGEEATQTLTSREAVVWINHRLENGRPYRQLQILLWQNAEVHEAAGTVTSGPVLFVTLNTSGTIRAELDEIAHEPLVGTRMYRNGNAIRQAIAKGMAGRTGTAAHWRVFDASGLAEPRKRKKPRPLVQVQSGGEMEVTTVEGERQVLTITGGAYLSRGVPGTGDYLEIHADAVVVFLPAGAADDSDVSDGQRLSTGLGDMDVEAAYLEGDVVMRQGANMIRASRLYYDFLEDRALILDAVVRTTITPRGIPLYVRAAEIRQLSRNRFAANEALLTTSEFHTPHYHVGARRVELINRTPTDLTGRQRGLRAGTFSLRHVTLNVGGHPLIYWPYIRGNIDTSETAIKSVRSGFSDDFGVESEVKWELFNVLGFQTPEGFDSTLSLEYFSRRGPAVGVHADYTRDTYFGLLRSYLLTDRREDFLGRERENPSARDLRGRLLLRHRQYLEDGWQLSLELSYISDDSFLEEFFESEFDNEKEQETLLYLKKQRANWAATALLQTRVLDFTTQTERLPDLAFFVVAEPVGASATWYGENRLGIVRYRPAEQTFRELLRDGRAVGSGSVARADSRQEIGIPFDVGPVRLVPFAVIRGTAWDDTPRGGSLARFFATYGLRGTMYLSRLYPDSRSTLFDIDGVRHIIRPDITAWVSHADRDPAARGSSRGGLFPFDETVENIGEADGIAVGVRQRWQTKRGSGKTRRTVDFLTLDVETAFFNGAGGDEITNGYTSFSRPENSIARNYINSSVIWRLNDRTALLSEMNYDVNDGEVDILNVSLAVERSPRFSYLVGYRLIEEGDSELLGFDMNYRLTEKHTLALRDLFDIGEGRTLDFTVAFIRKFPHWFGALSVAFDDAEDDFGVSVSFWPEGLPQATLGSRRFTGLATTTSLRAY